MYPCRMSSSGIHRAHRLCCVLCYAMLCSTKQMRIIVIALVFVVLLCSRAMRVDSFVSRCKCWVNKSILFLTNRLEYLGCSDGTVEQHQSGEHAAFSSNTAGRFHLFIRFRLVFRFDINALNGILFSDDSAIISLYGFRSLVRILVISVG